MINLTRHFVQAIRAVLAEQSGGITVTGKVNKGRGRKGEPFRRYIAHRVEAIYASDGKLVGHVDHFLHATKGWRSKRRPRFRPGFYPLGSVSQPQ
jgi:hypothetical protein